MTRTAKVPCPGKNCKKRCEARCEICGVPLGWTELIDFRKELGRNSEGTRKICWFSGAPGFLQLASRKRVPGTPGGRSCAEATWNLQISQANKLKKKRVSLAILFVFLPLPKFKLLNLLHFHLYTCKTTRFFGFRSGSMGCYGLFLFLCVTLDSPWFFSRFQCTTCRVTQLGSREASVAKVPSNSNLDAKCNLIVCQFPQVVASFAARNMDNSHPTLGRKWPKRSKLCFFWALFFVEPSIFPTHKGSDPSLFWRLRSRSPGHCGAGKVFLGA